MKRVLIVSHVDHARQRLRALTKYLPEHGWETVVLTPPSRNQDVFGSVVSVFFKRRMEGFERLVRRGAGVGDGEGLSEAVKHSGYFTRKYREVFHYPDAFGGWVEPAVVMAGMLHSTYSFDAVLSSSSPVSSHLVAQKVKRQFKIPWIADIRDLWSQNHNYPYSWLRHLFDERLESRTLRDADTLVTISQPFARNLQRRTHYMPDITLPSGGDAARQIYKDVYTITNGFDPDELNDGTTPLKEKFTVTYTGRIYPNLQDPDKFLRAVGLLIDRKVVMRGEVDVRFYGPNSSGIHEVIRQEGLEDVVHHYGLIPRGEAVQRQRESHLLLSLNAEKPDVMGSYSLKLFEYLAARRPILATGGVGEDAKEDLLRDTGAGVYVRTPMEIYEALERYVGEWRKTGSIGYRPRMDVVMWYSHRETARRFAELLNQYQPVRTEVGLDSQLR